MERVFLVIWLSMIFSSHQICNVLFQQRQQHFQQQQLSADTHHYHVTSKIILVNGQMIQQLLADGNDDKVKTTHHHTVQLMVIRKKNKLSFQFERKKPKIFSLDHTLETANGWFMDTSNLKVDQTARLISTQTSIPHNGVCFRFWYRVYGSKQGKLNILQKSLDTVNQTTTLIYTIRPNLDIDWKEALVYRDVLGNYQFIIEAIAGSILTDSDNIAIDDLTSSEGRKIDFQ